MDYLTANETALKWHISSRMVAYYCKAGRIDGAVKKGKTWFIPADAEKPVDGRNRGNGFKCEETYGIPYAENERVLDSIYHTSDIANSLGLTRETLRYYEEMGLITPKRSGDSKYREFDLYDMTRIMAIDFLKKRGFTTAEISALQGTAAEDYAKITQEKISAIHEKIRDLTEMTKRLEHMREFCEYTAQYQPAFSIEELPVYYVVNTLGTGASLDEYRDKVLAYLNVEKEDILSNMVRVVTFDENGYITSGMYIVKPFHGEGSPEQKTVLESGKSLHVLFTADNRDQSIMEKMFRLCYEWAEQNGFSFRGMCYIFARLVVLGELTDQYCYEVWVPLK